MKRYNYKGFLKLGLGLVLFLGIVGILGNVKNFRQLLDINWYRAWPVIILTLLINVLAAWRWHILLKRFSPNSDFTTLLRVMMMGRVAGHSTSQIAGDIGFRFMYMRSRSVDLLQGGLTIVLDKFLEGLLFIFVGTVFLYIILYEGMNNHSFILPALAIVLFFIAVWLIPGLLSLFEKLIPHKYLPDRLKTLKLGWIRFLLGVLTVGKYSTSAIRYMFIMFLCGIDLSFMKVFLGTSAAQLGLIAGITPGGLGIVEAGWAGALYYFGISSGLAAQFLVVQRLLIFFSVLVLAFLFFIHQVISKKQISTQEIDEKDMPQSSGEAYH